MAKFDKPDLDEVELTSVLQALSDPVRLAMVRRMAAEGELTCAQLGAPRPKSSMSHHFAVLRKAGIIQTRTEGNVHFNGLRGPELDRRFPGLVASILEAAAASPR